MRSDQRGIRAEAVDGEAALLQLRLDEGLYPTFLTSPGGMPDQFWPSVFDRQRRLVLTAGMLDVTRKVQREGDVMHVTIEHLVDLTRLLRSVGDRDESSRTRPYAVTKRGTAVGQITGTRMPSSGEKPATCLSTTCGSDSA